MDHAGRAHPTPKEARQPVAAQRFKILAARRDMHSEALRAQQNRKNARHHLFNGGGAHRGTVQARESRRQSQCGTSTQ